MTVMVISEILDHKLCEKDQTAQKCQIFNVVNDIRRPMNLKLSTVTYKSHLEVSWDMGFDLSMLEHLWNYEFQSYKQFPYPVFKQTFNWYIKYPETILRPDYFLQPFHTNLWLAIIFSIVLGKMLTLLLHKLLMSTDNQTSFIDGIFMIFESFCGKSGNDNIDEASLRIICIVLRTIAIIIWAFFNADISSYLTVDIPQIPFTNEKEFIDNGKFNLLLSNNSLLEGYVTKKSDANNKTIIYDFQNFTNEFPKMLCGHDNIAVPLSDDRINNYEIKCYLHQILKPLSSFYVSLVYGKPSSIMYLMNLKVIRLYESGVQEKIQNWYSQRSFTKDEIENDFRPVEIEQMILVLSISLIGTFVAILLFIGEIIMIKKKNGFRIITRITGLQKSTKPF